MGLWDILYVMQNPYQPKLIGFNPSATTNFWRSGLINVILENMFTKCIFGVNGKIKWKIRNISLKLTK